VTALLAMPFCFFPKLQKTRKGGNFISYLCHGLAFFLIFLAPLLGKGQFEILRRELEEKSLSRSGCYRMLIFWEWLYAGLALGLLLGTDRLGMAEVRRLFFALPREGFFWFSGAFGGMAWLTLGLWKSFRWKSFFRRITRDVAILFPITPREARLFAVLSGTAGVCEEILYRLFLYQYARSLGVSPGGAHLIGALAFGFAHVYQGWFGVVSAFSLGALFSVLFTATGSLILPMAVHVWIDLLVLLYRPSGASLFVSSRGFCYNKKNTP